MPHLIWGKGSLGHQKVITIKGVLCLHGYYGLENQRIILKNNNNGSPSPWLGIDYPDIARRFWKSTYSSWWAAPLITIKKEFDIDDFKESQRRLMPR